MLFADETALSGYQAVRSRRSGYVVGRPVQSINAQWPKCESTTPAGPPPKRRGGLVVATASFNPKADAASVRAMWTAHAERSLAAVMNARGSPAAASAAID
jgi:hypothetical protein